MQGCRGDLQRLGHTVTSRWIDTKEDAESTSEQRERAEMDIQDMPTP
jgi:hypothetical protein